MTPAEVRRTPESGRKITCKDFILDLLYDYLESALSPEALADVERHLSACVQCRSYLATYQRTREVAAQVVAEPMPDELKERLRRLLLDELTRRA